MFSAGEQQVLVVKEKGKIYAMGSKCTHFGAPLKTGIFCEGKVYCPWHGACFNSNSGTFCIYNKLYFVVTNTIIIDTCKLKPIMS